MKGRAEVKRRYESSLRGAQAQSTREAVIAAAGRLFAEQGYAATSIEEIAADACGSRNLLDGGGGVSLLGEEAPCSGDHGFSGRLGLRPSQARLVSPLDFRPSFHQTYSLTIRCTV